MAKEKRILIYFISFLLGFFLIMFIGISGVFAATYNGSEFTAQLFDNYGPTLNYITTSDLYQDSNHYEGIIPSMTSNGAGAAWGISSPIPIITNHNYSITVKALNDCSQPILSSYNRIGIGTDIGFAKYAYENNQYAEEIYSKALGKDFLLQFVFKAGTNASYIIFPFATSNSCSNVTMIINSITIEDLGEGTVTKDEINNSLNNQTNEINNSIENSTNTITGSINETENNINQNIDDMEQSIVDSNKETQDVIKDQFNSCRDSNNLFNATLINSTSGIIVNKDGSKITLPKATSGNGFTDTHTKLSVLAPELKVGDVVYLNFNTNSSYNKFIYLVTPQLVWYDGTSITITQEMLNSKVGFYGNRFTNGEDYQVIISDLIMSYKNTSFEPYGEICNNKIDDTNNKLDGIQGALTDSSAPNISGLENSAGWLPAGPLDSILNLPLTMLNSLTNSLTKTCAPLNLTLPYVNKNIQIPCLSAIFAQITGVNGLWTWVGTIASVLILYNYLLNLYAWVDRVLTLRAEFDEAMGADLANWGRL